MHVVHHGANHHHALAVIAGVPAIIGAGAAVIAGVDPAVSTMGGVSVAVLSLGGLFVRQMSKVTAEVWKIANRYRDEAAQARRDLDQVHWQLERYRYEHGDRPDDPGPFVPHQEDT